MSDTEILQTFTILRRKTLLQKKFIEVQLIYNVVLVSGVQHSESAICTHMAPLYQFLFLYRSLLSTVLVLCSKSLLVIYFLFYIQQCVYVDPSLPIYLSPLSLLVAISLFSTYVTIQKRKLLKTEASGTSKKNESQPHTSPPSSRRPASPGLITY